jgi:hypothetical protein
VHAESERFCNVFRKETPAVPFVVHIKARDHVKFINNLYTIIFTGQSLLSKLNAEQEVGVGSGNANVYLFKYYVMMISGSG